MGNERPAAATRGLGRVTGHRRMPGLPSHRAGGQCDPLPSKAPRNPGAGIDGGGELWEEPGGDGGRGREI